MTASTRTSDLRVAVRQALADIASAALLLESPAGRRVHQARRRRRRARRARRLPCPVTAAVDRKIEPTFSVAKR